MADDKSKTGPADASRISLQQAHEVAYWTRKFGCTEEQLAAAVKAVGNSAAAVEKYLAQ